MSVGRSPAYTQCGQRGYPEYHFEVVKLETGLTTWDFKSQRRARKKVSPASSNFAVGGTIFHDTSRANLPAPPSRVPSALRSKPVQPEFSACPARDRSPRYPQPRPASVAKPIDLARQYQSATRIRLGSCDRRLDGHLPRKYT